MASSTSWTIPDTRNYSSALGWATANWIDNITISGGPNGTRGFFTARLGFSGSAAGEIYGVTSLGNVGSVNLGYDLSGTGFSRINFKKSLNNDLITFSDVISKPVDIQIGFVFGASTGISVFLEASVQSGAYTHWNEDGEMIAGGKTDFSNTVMWGGITGVFDQFGAPVVAYTATGETGFDYTKSLIPAVPEPATWAMLIAGFGMVGFSARRRHRIPSVAA